MSSLSTEKLRVRRNILLQDSVSFTSPILILSILYTSAVGQPGPNRITELEVKMELFHKTEGTEAYTGQSACSQPLGQKLCCCLLSLCPSRTSRSKGFRHRSRK